MLDKKHQNIPCGLQLSSGTIIPLYVLILPRWNRNFILLLCVGRRKLDFDLIGAKHRIL